MTLPLLSLPSFLWLGLSGLAEDFFFNVKRVLFDRFGAFPKHKKNKYIFSISHSNGLLEFNLSNVLFTKIEFLFFFAIVGLQLCWSRLQ